MENKATHQIRQISKILMHEDMLKYLSLLIRITGDKDATIRKVCRVLSVLTAIKVDEKDKIRALIRAWYRANYGDRIFFADSDLHRKHKRQHGLGNNFNRRFASG
jgi:hypothetical protein